MPTVMIIGASRGIGLELARQYANDGWRVHATTRTPAQPGPLGALAGDIVLHALEVRDAAQIAALATAVEHEGIDVLIHNAGVSGWGMSRAEVMAINADAPIRVAQALLPAVTRSTEKKIILMTSQLGARYGRRRSLGLYGDSKGCPQRRLACPGSGVEPTRRDRHCHASRVGAHRHGWCQCITLSRRERGWDAAGDCPPDRGRAWALLDLEWTRAFVVILEQRTEQEERETWHISAGPKTP